MSTLSTRLRAFQDRVQDALADMSPRDRMLLLGLFSLAVVGLVGGGAWWMRSSLNDLDQRVEDRRMSLQQVQMLAADHAEAVGKAEAIEAQLRKHSGTDLSSFLEQAAQGVGVGDKLKQVREKSITSDGMLEEKLFTVSLKQLTTEELASFLYDMETAGYPLRVRTFKVSRKKRKDQLLLDVDMDVSAYRVLDTPEEAG